MRNSVYCPLRFPCSASKLFPGGTRNSESNTTESNWSSFLRAILHNCIGQARLAALVFRPLKRSSVALSANDRITVAIIAWISCYVNPNRDVDFKSSLFRCSYLLRPNKELTHRAVGVKAARPGCVVAVAKRTLAIGSNDVL